MPGIISASRRTDLPAWYGRWFAHRLRAGSARYRNPFSRAIHEVSLRRRDVAAFVFWTRDAVPFFPVLDRLDGEGYAYYFQYTCNGYGPPFEEHPPPERGVRGLERLAGRLGPGRVVWRYDPIFLAPGRSASFHIKNFRALAARFSGMVDTVTVSFLDRYRKVERNLSRLGLDARGPAPVEATRLLTELHAIAAAAAIRLATCCEEPFRPPGVARGACIDADRIARIAPGTRWTPRPGATRKGCACTASRDIGAYDTCPSGCAYCYAVTKREAALRNRADHRPGTDLLLR